MTLTIFFKISTDTSFPNVGFSQSPLKLSFQPILFFQPSMLQHHFSWFFCKMSIFPESKYISLTFLFRQWIVFFSFPRPCGKPDFSNIMRTILTEKSVHLFSNLLLYNGMSGEQVQRPRDPSGCCVVTLRMESNKPMSPIISESVSCSSLGNVSRVQCG